MTTRWHICASSRRLTGCGCGLSSEGTVSGRYKTEGPFWTSIEYSNGRGVCVRCDL
ncbi:hypothetical protein BJV82DRAFT_595348, partial [Fennellomyces sp. T-0311]